MGICAPPTPGEVVRWDTCEPGSCFVGSLVCSHFQQPLGLLGRVVFQAQPPLVSSSSRGAAKGNKAKATTTTETKVVARPAHPLDIRKFPNRAFVHPSLSLFVGHIKDIVHCTLSKHRDEQTDVLLCWTTTSFAKIPFAWVPAFERNSIVTLYMVLSFVPPGLPTIGGAVATRVACGGHGIPFSDILGPMAWPKLVKILLETGVVFEIWYLIFSKTSSKTGSFTQGFLDFSSF